MVSYLGDILYSIEAPGVVLKLWDDHAIVQTN